MIYLFVFKCAMFGNRIAIFMCDDRGILYLPTIFNSGVNYGMETGLTLVLRNGVN